jgi:peroxiredoxin
VEFPHLEALRDTFGTRGLAVLAVETTNRPEHARRFVESRGFGVPVLLDDSNVARGTYRILGTPTTFIIDRAGRVVFQHVGFEPGQEAIYRRVVERLLPYPPG